MEIALFIMIILIAATLQTSTGFGFSILATPFLLFLFQPAEAIQINLLLSLIISSALIMQIKKDIDFGILKRFITGSIIGLPVGMVTFLFVDVNKLKLVISIVIILLTVLLILSVRMKQTKRRDLIVGGLSGLLTTSIGMPGPPLLLYFSGTDTKKETLRGTTLAFYLFIYLVSLVIQVLFAGTTKTMWVASLWALPLVFIGLYVGQILFKWLNQTAFRIFTYVILLGTGGYLLVDWFSKL